MLDNLCTGPLAIIMINYISYLCNTGEYNGGRRTMVFYMTVMKCKVEEYIILAKIQSWSNELLQPSAEITLQFAFEPLKRFRFDQNLQLRV